MTDRGRTHEKLALRCVGPARQLGVEGHASALLISADDTVGSSGAHLGQSITRIPRSLLNATEL